MWRILLVVALALGAHSSTVDVEKTIKAEGYPAETHQVTTSDGYILTLHRIPRGKGGIQGNTRKVVFLMHSIFASSNSFIYNGPQYGMAYNLADAGYDVWMGNARGNVYSNSHISLSPVKDAKDFYDFSYEEIGLYDLPAMMDYVLTKTKHEKLHYIGHTQGGSVFFVLNSMKPAYQSKFASAHLLAGLGYEKHFPNIKYKLFCLGIDVFYSGLLLTGTYQLADTKVYALLEKFVDFKIPDPDYLISPVSSKQVAHFGQNFRDESFRRWNYGVGNLLKYGSILHPSYDLSKIKVNITMHYAKDDILQGTEDVLDMVRDLPNARARRIPRDDFNFVDYAVSKDVKDLVTDDIIESMKYS